MAEHDHWLGLARWTPLAVSADLDGTLIPFTARRTQDKPDPELAALLAALAAAPGVQLAVVSGRARARLETFFDGIEGCLLVAEHGGWRRGRGAWEPWASAESTEVVDLATRLESIARRHPGAVVDRTTWSVAFHFGEIRVAEREAAEVEVDSLVESWLATHAQYEAVRGDRGLEVRPARVDKSGVVPWLREQAGADARLLALGDDVSDEGTFASLGPNDESVLVGREFTRATAAHWRLTSPGDARRFLQWILDVRGGAADAAPPVVPRPVRHARAEPATTNYRLLVVSNRLPELRSPSDPEDASKRNVGGLVSALEPALAARDGVWLGWSGRATPHADESAFGLDETGKPGLAWVDFPDELRRDYYNGFCNGALWPLLHSFPSRVRLADADWSAYERANRAFAQAATQLVGANDTVWVHDYHLLLLGRELRARGHTGPVGLFLHVPFPAPDIFFILPWAEQILVGMLQLDLVGFHTDNDATNFRRCVATLPGTRVGDDAVESRGRRTRVGVFPIGIIPEQFQTQPEAATEEEAAKLMRAIAPSRLVLGVDRLDYTKGIPERIAAFARLLEIVPEWRRKVALVQISVPSRADVAEYAEQRDRIEHIVGRTNGEVGEPDWVPIRYLYRSFGREQLSLLYRNAAVGYVTPLRDGMNLVAKEYVAAQDPNDPGVLVLSRFAGAAAELRDALLTNPWHVDGLARDLDRALRMGLEERRERHAKLLAVVQRTTAITWAEDFLATLAQCARSG